MSLYDDLTDMLTPYADKINQNVASLNDLRDDLDNLDVETDKTLSVDGKPADAKAVGDIVNPMRTATDLDKGKALKQKPLRMVKLLNGSLAWWVDLLQLVR